MEGWERGELNVEECMKSLMLYSLWSLSSDFSLSLQDAASPL